jgi:Flp pilus assembly protein TadD
MQNQIKSAISLYNSGQFQEALALITGLIKESPREAILHNISGACYSALGQIRRCN